MKPRFEQVPLAHDRSFACLEFKERVFDCPYHFHPEVELTHVVESHGSAMIGSGLHRFGPGDVYLIGAAVPHAFHNSPAWRNSGRMAHSRVLQFRKECLGVGFFNLPELKSVATLLAKAGRGMVFCGRSRTRLAQKLSTMAKSRGAARVVGLLDLLLTAASAPSREVEFIVSRAGRMQPGRAGFDAAT